MVWPSGSITSSQSIAVFQHSEARGDAGVDDERKTTPPLLFPFEASSQEVKGDSDQRRQRAKERRCIITDR